MELKQEQKYMMSFAWVNPKELYLLDAFPEVIMDSSIGTHPGLSMDNLMVILLSVQSDKNLVKTNGKVMRANKKTVLTTD